MPPKKKEAPPDPPPDAPPDPSPPPDAPPVDYGLLPPKTLQKLFGTSVILKNPDDASDGTYDCIKSPSGSILCLRNPRTRRWVRYSKGTAQRLIEEGDASIEVDTEVRRCGRKRKSDRNSEIDHAEVAARVEKKRVDAGTLLSNSQDRVNRKKIARKRWRVAGLGVRVPIRFSQRLRERREEEESGHTGLSLDFYSMDI